MVWRRGMRAGDTCGGGERHLSRRAGPCDRAVREPARMWGGTRDVMDHVAPDSASECCSRCRRKHEAPGCLVVAQAWVCVCVCMSHGVGAEGPRGEPESLGEGPCHIGWGQRQRGQEGSQGALSCCGGERFQNPLPPALPLSNLFNKQDILKTQREGGL